MATLYLVGLFSLAVRTRAFWFMVWKLERCEICALFDSLKHALIITKGLVEMPKLRMFYGRRPWRAECKSYVDDLVSLSITRVFVLAGTRSSLQTKPPCWWTILRREPSIFIAFPVTHLRNPSPSNPSADSRSNVFLQKQERSLFAGAI